jgi:putative pyruvate formate lyase activating enzyme
LISWVNGYENFKDAAGFCFCGHYTLERNETKEEILAPMEPSYLKTWSSGALRERARIAWDLLNSCTLCPRRCRVNRVEGETGLCGQGAKAKVARALPHFGEEPPISGTGGAGTVFFTGCALRCLYCQNYQISQEKMGDALGAEDLAGLFLRLQEQGCHNLDLVSPTPHLPFIFQALEIAIPRGLKIPLVYNTHGYLLKEILDLLDGIVDIYLPDMKYAEEEDSESLSRVDDYPLFNLAAVKQMYHQVGILKTDEKGLGVRGLLVRHLVLPGGRSNSIKVLERLGDLSRRIPISLMAQYRPTYQAFYAPPLHRSLENQEYDAVVAQAEALGFEEIFVQELESASVYHPDFTREDPFAFK